MVGTYLLGCGTSVADGHQNFCGIPSSSHKVTISIIPIILMNDYMRYAITIKSGHTTPVMLKAKLSSRMMSPSNGVSVCCGVCPFESSVVGGVILTRGLGGAGGFKLTSVGLLAVVGERAGGVNEISVGAGGFKITLLPGGGCDHAGGGGLISIFGLEGVAVCSMYAVGFGVGFFEGLSVVFIISNTV